MKYIIFLLLILVGKENYSQHLSATVSEKLKYNGSLDLISFGDHFFAMDMDWNSQLAYTAKLYKAKHSVKLIKYDRKMNVVKEIKLAKGAKQFGPLPSILRKYNDKLYLFSYELTDENGTLNIVCSEIDPIAVDLVNSKKVLHFEQKNFGFFKAMFGRFSYNFIVSSSPDQKKLLVCWNSSEINKIFFAVLDAQINVLRHGEEEIMGSSKSNVHNVCVDNAGNIFVAHNFSNIYTSRADGMKKNIILKPDVTEADYFFIVPSKTSGTLHISGVFSGKDKLSKGVFSQELDIATLSLTEDKRTLIPNDIKLILEKQLFNHAGQPKKNFESTIRFEPIKREDGQIDLLAKSIYTVDYYSSNNVLTQRLPICGSSLYIRFHQNGAFFTRIPKLASALEDFFVFSSGNKTFIIYETDEKKSDQEIIDYNGKGESKFSLVSAIIDEDGKLRSEVFQRPFTIADAIKHTIQIEPRIIVIPGAEYLSVQGITRDIELPKKGPFYWTTIEFK